MEFDSNLSPDFCFTHLDETTGKSLFITLDESTQPENGSTRLTMHVQYINEQQELFENIDSLRAVREKYFEAFTKLKDDEHIFITNGDRTVAAIADELWEKVSSLL